jgi:hypothetical protein
MPNTTSEDISFDDEVNDFEDIGEFDVTKEDNCLE